MCGVLFCVLLLLRALYLKNVTQNVYCKFTIIYGILFLSFLKYLNVVQYFNILLYR